MDEEIYQDLLQTIHQFKSELTLVEGKKDLAALSALGFSNVITLDSPLFEIVERVEHRGVKKVLILTDLDSEGKRLYSRLKKDLTDRGISIDDRLRELLFKTDLRQVEGLASYLENHTRARRSP